MENKKFAGFWIRTVASLIDAIIFSTMSGGILYAIYGARIWLSDHFILGFWDFIINWIIPFIVTIWFWRKFKATPGKMIFKLEVVDATTGNRLSIKQSIIRWLSYIPAGVCLGLGIIWVGIDKKKQGWHDKWAKTVVICNEGPKEKVVFNKE